MSFLAALKRVKNRKRIARRAEMYPTPSAPSERPFDPKTCPKGTTYQSHGGSHLQKAVSYFYCAPPVEVAGPKEPPPPKKGKGKQKRAYDIPLIIQLVDKALRLSDDPNYAIANPAAIGITDQHKNSLEPRIQPGIQENNRKRANKFAAELMSLGRQFALAGGPMLMARFGSGGGASGSLGSDVKRVILDRVPEFGGNRTVGQIYIETYDVASILKTWRPKWDSVSPVLMKYANDPERYENDAALIVNSLDGNVFAMMGAASRAADELKPYLKENLSKLEKYVNLALVAGQAVGAANKAKSVSADAKKAAQQLFKKVISPSSAKKIVPLEYKGQDAWDWLEIPPKRNYGQESGMAGMGEPINASTWGALIGAGVLIWLLSKE